MSGSRLVDGSPIQAPSFPVPAHSCDCHCHIIGIPEIYPLSPDRSYTPAPALVAQYLPVLRALGFERTVLVQPSIYGFDNRCMLDAIAQLGDRNCRGIVTVEDDISDADLSRLHSLGVRGVRYNLVHGQRSLSMRAVSRVAARISDLGWHVQVYVDGDLLPELFAFLATLPARVVIDHMGQIMTAHGIENPAVRALRKLLDSGNAWVKLSGYRASSAGYPFRDLALLASVLIGATGERCLWGSDWPHANFSGWTPDAGLLLNLMAEWTPSDATRKRILVDNPAELYGFTD